MPPQQSTLFHIIGHLREWCFPHIGHQWQVHADQSQIVPKQRSLILADWHFDHLKTRSIIGGIAIFFITTFVPCVSSLQISSFHQIDYCSLTCPIRTTPIASIIPNPGRNVNFFQNPTFSTSSSSFFPAFCPGSKICWSMLVAPLTSTITEMI